jgi:sec-independent protein translocase protein TatA
MLAAIEGPDFLIVIAVVLLLFGSTQIPKLARSLGSASKEFKHGQEAGHEPDPVVATVPVSAAVTTAPVAAGPVTVVPVPTAVVATPEANGSAPAAPSSVVVR